MRKALALLSLVTLLAPCLAMADGHNEMSGFRYLNCSVTECVELTAPTALVSSLRGGFSARGGAHLRILELDGRVKFIYDGESAILNGDSQTIEIEKSPTAFALYSLKTSSLSLFDPKVSRKVIR